MANSNAPIRPVSGSRPAGTAAPPRQPRGRLIAGATLVGVFGLFGAIVWYAWMESHAIGGDEVPLLAAPTVPWKVSPENPGGLSLVGENRPIGRLLEAGEGSVEEPERILPVEDPDVRSLAAVLPSGEPSAAPAGTEAKDGQADGAASASEPQLAQGAPPSDPRSLLPPKPGPEAGAAPASEPHSGPEAGEPAARPTDTEAGPSLPPTGSLPPSAPAAAAGPRPAATAADRPASASRAPAAQATVAAPVDPAASPGPATVAAGQAGDSGRRTSGSATAVGAPAPASAGAMRPVALPTGGTIRVQLAAVSRREGIEARWASLQRRWPQVLAGRELVVEPLESGGRTLYRIQAAGYRSRAEAEAACRTIRAGGGECFPVGR
ncbi:Cell division protein FtsN [bacterium HR40]|nr:Cell division protein FtsN [bacterium HR40]